MKVSVCAVESDYAGFNHIAHIAKQSHNLFCDSVELDFSGCDFFDANMTAPLYTVISRIRNELNDVHLVNMNRKLSIILRKNRFLVTFQVKPEIDTNHTTVPFKIFRPQASEQFYEYLDSHMHGKGIPTMTEGLTRRFRQSLVEIFQNAAIHSRSRAGIFSCGQFFPRKHRLDFTISDAGVSIRDKVRKHLRNAKVSSKAAIEWALVEGNTTKKGRQPGGLGLDLLKDFIRMNDGKLQIVSRYGYYQFSSDQQKLMKLDYDFPGTCVNIEINTKDTSSYCLDSELNSNDIF